MQSRATFPPPGRCLRGSPGAAAERAGAPALRPSASRLCLREARAPRGPRPPQRRVVLERETLARRVQMTTVVQRRHTQVRFRLQILAPGREVGDAPVV